MNIFERILPAVGALVLASLLFVFKFNFMELKDYKFVYSNIISVSSIMIGALITMVAILTAFTGKRVMIKIKEQKADNLLRSYFIYPISSGLFVAIYSIILGIVIDEKTFSSTVCLYLSTVWVLITSYFILSTLRVFYIMLKLLNAVYDEDAQPKFNRIEASSDKVSFEGTEDNL